MAQKPTVLFVHGSWHSPAHFVPVRAAFEAAGYPTCCPLLPTVNEPHAAGLPEDAAALRRELDRLIEGEGKDVVVVMHSYGGMVGNEAVRASLGKSARAEEGKPGGVLRLVYLCAFVLHEGASPTSALGGELPPYITIHEDGTYTMDQEPARRLYNDVPEAEQQHWVSKLRPHPVVAQQTPLTYAAHKHHPSSYIFCENDQALPLEIQEMMVNGAGVAMRTERLPSGHSPFLSMPERLLETVQKTAGI